MNTMKLGFSTLGCPKWSFEEILKNAQAMGFSGIEMRGIQDDINTADIWCFRPENQEKAKELLRKYDIEIIGIGSSCTFDSEEKFEKAIPEGKTAIDIATLMHVPNIRVYGNNLPEGSPKETIDRVISGIEQLCQYSETKGNSNILLEIHGDFNTIEVLAPITAALGHYKTFGIIWDVEHSYTSYGQEYLPFYQSIKPWIRHVHFKDATRNEKNERAIHLMGEGSIPLPAIYKTLEDDGYSGYYSFEWEKRWVPELPEPEIAFPHFVDYMSKL